MIRHGEAIRVAVRGREGDQPVTPPAPSIEMLAAASVACFAAGAAALMSRPARVFWLG
jgi:hypothetical protein